MSSNENAIHTLTLKIDASSTVWIGIITEIYKYLGSYIGSWKNSYVCNHFGEVRYNGKIVSKTGFKITKGDMLSLTVDFNKRFLSYHNKTSNEEGFLFNGNIETSTKIKYKWALTLYFTHQS